ncbi:hypothetical protein [Candidatus Electronema sp. PJ]|uniref:hypothetical protein n=1 Tax=Candidatus Electronema sp. PJ TaxID=3401572 RepID=UPI003AA8638E
MKENSPIQQLITNPELSTHFVDSVTISGRSDNLFLTRFSLQLPEGMFEQSRVLATKDFLCRFVDALCANLNYYPTPKKEE